MQSFNPFDIERQEQIIRTLCGSTGKNISMNHSFYCELGYNIHVDDNFLRYNCTILDTAEVIIGNYCMILLNVSIYTTCHSLEPNQVPPFL